MGFFSKLFGRAEPALVPPSVNARPSDAFMQRAPTTPASFGNRPRVGDTVWVAPKRTWGEITKLQSERGAQIVDIVHGPMHTNSSKQAKPVFYTRTPADQLAWSEDAKAWILGSGPTPRIVRGKIIAPEATVARFGAAKT